MGPRERAVFGNKKVSIWKGNKKDLLCIIWFTLSLLLLGAHGQSSREEQLEPQPSLDALLQRVNSYWEFLTAGKKLQAMEFVEASCREDFVSWPFPAFREPVIASLTPLSSGSEVDVKVTVKRLLAGLGAEVDWPVTNRWVFSQGNWYVNIKTEGLPIFGASPGTKVAVPSPVEVRQRSEELRSALQLEGRGFDFGTVRQGIIVPLTVEYQLTLPEALPYDFNDLPSELLISEAAPRMLEPGEKRKIRLEFFTANYNGEVKLDLVMLIRYKDVEVPYELRLSGYVYSPLSALPRVLRFAPGESEKEVVVQNNSKSEARFDTAYDQRNCVEVTQLPAALSPGARCSLMVKRIGGPADKEYTSELVLFFADPIEDMSHLIIPVVLNFRNREETPLTDLLRNEIQGLLKKGPPEVLKPKEVPPR